MTFWFKGHHHNTSLLFAFKTRLSKWFGSYKWPASSWLDTHIDGCCDYWTPVSDPKAQRAFMLDDELGLKADDPVSDLVVKSRKPTQTHTKSAQSDPKRKANI